MRRSVWMFEGLTNVDRVYTKLERCLQTPLNPTTLDHQQTRWPPRLYMFFLPSFFATEDFKYIFTAQTSIKWPTKSCKISWRSVCLDDDVIEWKPWFSVLLALCVGNSPVTGEFPHKGQWCGVLMFSLICAWINDWVNNRKTVDLTVWYKTKFGSQNFGYHLWWTFGLGYQNW